LLSLVFQTPRDSNSTLLTKEILIKERKKKTKARTLNLFFKPNCHTNT